MLFRSAEQGPLGLLCTNIPISCAAYGLSWWLRGKESACNAEDTGLIPGSRRFPWRRKWQPTPVFLPGESHGQRSLAGSSPGGHKESTTEHSRTYCFGTAGHQAAPAARKVSPGHTRVWVGGDEAISQRRAAGATVKSEFRSYGGPSCSERRKDTIRKPSVGPSSTRLCLRF